jgi:tetratricopeptide (TPR) repeat protein
MNKLSSMVLAVVVLLGCQRQAPPGNTSSNSGAAKAKLSPAIERQISSRSASEIDSAIERDTSLIQAGEASAVVFRDRGDMWCLKRDLQRAIADYDAALELDSEYAPAWHNRGRAKKELGEFENAIADYTQAIRCQPDYRIAFANRGVLLMRVGRLKEASVDLSKAVQLDPNDANSLNALARIYASAPDPRLRDGKKAADLATRACELSGWNNFEHVESLAAACARNGDYEKAAKWQSKVIEMAGSNANAGMQDRLDAYEHRRPIEAN